MLPNLNSWLKVLNKKWTHYISNDNNFPLSEIPNWTWQLECLLPHLQCDTTSAPSTLKALHGKSSEVTSTKVPFKLKIARWIKGGYYYEHSLNTCPLKWVFMFTQSQFKFHFLGIKRKWWRRAFPHLESHESEHAFAQSCPTLCNLMDCRLLHPWDFPGKNTAVGCHFLLQGIFPTQGSNPSLPHCRHTPYPYHLSHQEIPRKA